jgi:hypothetical protein
MKLAVSAKLISFILKGDVAIVEKKPIWITAACGRLLRVGRIGWKSEFLVHGGVRLIPTDKFVRLEDKVYHVIGERRLRYGTIMIADKTASGIKFRHPLIIRQGYLVFNVVGKDAKLTDDEPTHVLTVFEHAAYYRKAEIKITFEKNEGIIVFNDWTSCRQRSTALAIAFIPVNSQFVVCYNTGADKHRCYDMIATVPPVPRREFFA